MGNTHTQLEAEEENKSRMEPGLRKNVRKKEREHESERVKHSFRKESRKARMSGERNENGENTLNQCKKVSKRMKQKKTVDRQKYIFKITK